MRLRTLFIIYLVACSVSAQITLDYMRHLQSYRLDNGLTVYLLEDSTARDVCGMMVVKAGSTNEEAGKTGVAACLKYMLDSGTDSIGSLDWAKEKPLLDEISRQYDLLANKHSKENRDEINSRIAELSRQAANYASPLEFKRLQQHIGVTESGNEVTADASFYWSCFPASSVALWLELNARRFTNPVFRNFKNRLNLFYEHYNATPENPLALYTNEHIYKNTPYARPKTGYAEDLKHLRPSLLQEFYNRWYVADNMALVLVGNFNAGTVKPIINKYYKEFKSGNLPDKNDLASLDLSGKDVLKHYSAYLHSHTYWYFKGVGYDNPDYIPLDFTLYFLTNNYNTGLLDELSNQNITNYVMSSNVCRSKIEGGVVSLSSMAFDGQTESLKHLKHIVSDILKGIQSPAAISDDRFNATKRMYLNDCKMAELKSNSEKARQISDNFIFGIERQRFLTQQRVRQLTKDDVARCAERYLSETCKTIIFDFDKRGPDIHNRIPIDTLKVLWQQGKESEYAKCFRRKFCPRPDLNTGVKDSFVVRQLPNGAMLHYMENKNDDNFTLRLQYDRGTRYDPKLEYAVALINKCGILPDKNENALRHMFFSLGSTMYISADENHLYIDITGNDSTLEHTFGLAMAVTQIPKFDENLLHSYMMTCQNRRIVEQTNVYYNYDALKEYVKYKDKSKYINRIPYTSFYFQNGILHSTVTGDFEPEIFQVYLTDYVDMGGVIRSAMNSTVDVFYHGNTPISKVGALLSGIQAKPYDRERLRFDNKRLAEYDNMGVWLLNNRYIPESRAFIYIKTDVPDVAGQIRSQAFNLYFADLLTEKFVMEQAQSVMPVGAVEMPFYVAGEAYFHGEIQTDHQRLNDMLDDYMELLYDMPRHPELFDGIVRTLYASYVKQDPDMRHRSPSFDGYRLSYPQGFPLDEWLAELEKLTFDDMMAYYERNIRHKPAKIAIMGDARFIDTERIEAKIGRVSNIGISRLFLDKTIGRFHSEQTNKIRCLQYPDIKNN